MMLHRDDYAPGYAGTLSCMNYMPLCIATAHFAAIQGGKLKVHTSNQAVLVHTYHPRDRNAGDVETDRSTGEGSRATQGEAEGSEDLVREESTEVEQLWEGQVLTHFEVERESPKDKPNPEGPVSVHFAPQRDPPKDKPCLEGTSLPTSKYSGNHRKTRDTRKDKSLPNQKPSGNK
ncbi:hypothetical protein TNCV_1449511 [Trichonephila clavipes]|nr:hypothetical protein TNCV_1449511 [Trichonephila clavipes]